ncbi:MAG: Hexuronate transporter [Syntrophorhabdaceae bacterium PtaU1.Bin034]|jgi:sugar phosphate permease|nr:MAG: Hexuronate transporter [Syntrophorhabdaceae bacterium PtaU1.Bin034]
MRLRYQWVIVAVVWTSHTIYYFNYMALGTLAPLIKSDLGLSSARIGLLTSAVSIGSMVFQIPAGIFSDRLGARWVMAMGLALVGISSILISSVSSYVVIFLLLVALGAGISANQTPGSKAIIMWFTASGRATAMGIKQTGVTVGGMLASFFLPLLALSTQSWRYPCIIAGAASLIGAVILILIYRDPGEETFHASIIVGSYADGLRSLLRNRDFLLVCMAGALLMANQFAFCAYFVLYASTALRFPLTECGILLAISFLAGALGRVGWSVASDYLFKGRRNGVLAFVCVVCVLVCCGIGLLPVGAPLAFVYIAAIIFGLTGLGWNALYLTRVGEMQGKELAGTATGVSFVLCNIGAVLGPPLFGSLVDLTHGYTIPWFFLASCMATVALLTVVQKKSGMNQGREVECA